MGVIDTVERYRCGLCGYITETKAIIARIKTINTCPACQNGKPKVWHGIPNHFKKEF